MIESANFYKFKKEKSHRPLRQTGARFINSAFQLKYTSYLLMGVMLCLFLFLIPSWYMLRENYQIFTQLAYETHPSIISNLEREFNIATTLFIISMFSIASLIVYLGIRMTGNLISPLQNIERHIKKITYGDFSNPKFNFRSDDDYLQLLENYAYFYESLRAQTENELHQLQNLIVDSKDHNSLIIIKNLIQTKKSQLGLNTTPTNVVKLFEVDGRRRAS